MTGIALVYAAVPAGASTSSQGRTPPLPRSVTPSAWGTQHYQRAVLFSLSKKGSESLLRHRGELAAMEPEDRAAFVGAFERIGEIASKIAEARG